MVFRNEKLIIVYLSLCCDNEDLVGCFVEGKTNQKENSISTFFTFRNSVIYLCIINHEWIYVYNIAWIKTQRVCLDCKTNLGWVVPSSVQATIIYIDIRLCIILNTSYFSLLDNIYSFVFACKNQLFGKYPTWLGYWNYFRNLI